MHYSSVSTTRCTKKYYIGIDTQPNGIAAVCMDRTGTSNACVAVCYWFPLKASELEKNRPPTDAKLTTSYYVEKAAIMVKDLLIELRKYQRDKYKGRDTFEIKVSVENQRGKIYSTIQTAVMAAFFFACVAYDWVALSEPIKAVSPVTWKKHTGICNTGDNKKNKNTVVDATPVNIKDIFIKEVGKGMKSRIHDLCDAFFIAQYTMMNMKE